MGKLFRAGDITQEVTYKKAQDSDYKHLEYGYGKGYLNSLSKEYMSEVRDFLQQDKNPKLRILFVSPKEHTARQAYLCMLRSRKEKACTQATSATDGYDYGGLLGQRVDATPAMDEVLLISPKSREENRDEPVTFMPARELRRQKRENMEECEQADSLLIELETVKEPEEKLEELLAYRNPNIAIVIKPTASYQYLLKRLVFEGGYKVIHLPEVGFGDYLSYAQEFLEFHGFSARTQDLEEMLCGLMAYRGELLCEGDLYTHLGRVLRAHRDIESRALSKEELRVQYEGQGQSAKEELERVVGLEDVKRILLRRLQAKRLMRDKQGMLHSNYIAEGPPGTGKSKMARLLAKLMAEMGISNGRFVDASRSDLIGKYVGHTANLVRGAFERAEGGVLFIDEASFLLEGDQYVKEAVIELVRYMELYPQTTVIFATYPKEGEKLLHCDPGFSSRISQILEFSSYSEDELYEIMEGMAKEYGFILEKACKEEMISYIRLIRDREDFGNAREVRKLLEATIEECGMRLMGQSTELLSAQDMKKARAYLYREEKTKTIGFGFIPKEATV